MPVAYDNRLVRFLFRNHGAGNQPTSFCLICEPSQGCQLNLFSAMTPLRRFDRLLQDSIRASRFPSNFITPPTMERRNYFIEMDVKAKKYTGSKSYITSIFFPLPPLRINHQRTKPTINTTSLQTKSYFLTNVNHLTLVCHLFNI